MSTDPVSLPTTRVMVTDGALYIRDFEEHDTEVVRVVSEADDPVSATSQCLRVGARALRAANVTVDVDVIERSFEALETRFEARVTAAVDEIATTTSGLLDEEDGALTGALAQFRADFDQLLGDTFDADSKSSVIAKIEDLVLGTMRGLITPEIDDSPIGRLKKELVETMRKEMGDVATEVRRVTDHLGIADATAEVFEKTTAKGFVFEDFVDGVVGGLAAVYGDLAEPTGVEKGAAASKKGDEVITLNRDDTYGIEARFAIEVKNRKLNMRSTLQELAATLENRDALAAIAVFRSQDQAPTSVAFQYTDNKAIVVLDPDDSDPSALRLAYMWARWTVRRALTAGEREGVDLEAVGALIESASRALERHTAIKRFHTQATKGISQAAEQVADLISEVSDALNELEAALKVGEDT